MSLTSEAIKNAPHPEWEGPDESMRYSAYNVRTCCCGAHLRSTGTETLHTYCSECGEEAPEYFDVSLPFAYIVTDKHTGLSESFDDAYDAWSFANRMREDRGWLPTVDVEVTAQGVAA